MADIADEAAVLEEELAAAIHDRDAAIERAEAAEARLAQLRAVLS